MLLNWSWIHTAVPTNMTKTKNVFIFEWLNKLTQTPLCQNSRSIFYEDFGTEETHVWRIYLSSMTRPWCPKCVNETRKMQNFASSARKLLTQALFTATDTNLFPQSNSFCCQALFITFLFQATYDFFIQPHTSQHNDVLRSVELCSKKEKAETSSRKKLSDKQWKNENPSL